MTQQQSVFLQMAVPLAQAAQKRWGVPTSVTLAQAIIESSNELGWGMSELAREANNFFGIKASNTHDPNTYVELKTHEYVGGTLKELPADFARFTTPGDSFDAHALLLASARRYQPAMHVAKDPLAFAASLGPCGYSTNPNYGGILRQLMTRYDLTQFDIPPDGSANQAAAAA